MRGCDACKKKNCVITRKNKDEVCILCGVVHIEAGKPVQFSKTEGKKQLAFGSDAIGMMERIRQAEVEPKPKPKDYNPMNDPDSDEYVSFA